jgi:hypothetical protein
MAARRTAARISRKRAIAKLLRGPKGDEVLVVVAGPDGAIARSVHVERVGARELERGMRGATLALEAPANRVDLSEAEAEVLALGGFEAGPANAISPTETTRMEHLRLLAESLSPEQAATRLGVNASRIRQRLGARTLYGVKDGRGWKLPLFQFAGKRLVPGLEKVLPKLPRTLHPIAIARWLAAPSPDLDGISPRAWLLEGRAPERVADLAAEL